MARYAFQMVSLIKDGKMSQMANPGRVIYRAGSLTLSIRLSQRAKYLTLFFFCKLKERVIQHEVLWPEVPLDTIEASVQPFVLNQPFVKQIKHWSGFVRNLFLKNSR